MDDEPRLVAGLLDLLGIERVRADQFDAVETRVAEKLKRRQNRPLGLSEHERFLPSARLLVIGGGEPGRREDARGGQELPAVDRGCHRFGSLWGTSRTQRLIGQLGEASVEHLGH